MRPEEGSAGVGGGTGGLTHPPGSRPSRLSDASKQLEILLEDVDIDEEPALAEALTNAVSAAARATDFVDGGEETGPVEAGSETTRDHRTGTAAVERSAAREPAVRNTERLESDGVALARRIGDE